MQRVLLGEIEGTCITCTKSKKIPHEYSTIIGIQKSIHEILMNLKEIVLRSTLYRTRDAFIYIILLPLIEIVDNTQYIANLIKLINLCIELKIKRNYRCLVKMPNNFQNRNYLINVVFMHIRNVNHNIHFYVNENEKQEIFFFSKYK
ncbi:hypothetical protein UlMin_032894 [Ulmus minor]